MKKIALLIGGGIQELDAIRDLKSSDWLVWVVDRNPSCASAPIADKLIVADGYNAEDIIQALVLSNVNNVKPDVVFTLTELTTSVAIVSHALGIHAPSIKSVAISQSKGASKFLWIKSGVKTPAGIVLKNYSDLKKTPRFSYPCVVKPAIGAGGNGVSLVKKNSDLKKAVGLAMDISRNNVCVIEDYIEGTLVDGNGFFDRMNKFIPLSISTRLASGQFLIDSGAVCPTSFSEDEKRKFFQLFETACREIGLVYGPVKIDAIFDGKDFYVLEIAARFHGPRNSLHLIPMAYERSLLKSTLGSMADARSLHWDYNNVKRASMHIDLFPKRTGIIKKLSAPADAKNIYARFFKKDGEIILDKKKAFGHVTVSAKNLDGCRQLSDDYIKTIEVEIYK